jgi:hypothetical protein
MILGRLLLGAVFIFVLCSLLSAFMDPTFREVENIDQISNIKLNDDEQYVACYIGSYRYLIKRSIQILDKSGESIWSNTLKMEFRMKNDIYIGDHSSGLLIVSNRMKYYIFIDKFNRILNYDIESCDVRSGAFSPKTSSRLGG